MNKVPHITIEQAAAIWSNPIDKKESTAIFNKRIDAYNKANAEQVQPLITAEEARKLGAGNAKWFCFGVWNVCDGSEGYVDHFFDGEKCKYRATE